MYRVIWVCLTILISSCSAQRQQSIFLGNCKRMLQPSLIYKGNSSQYRGEYIVSVERDIDLDRRGDKVFGHLNPNEVFRINRVLKNGDWGWGDFLRIEVEILSGDYAGLIVDIPSCVPYHPSPRWIENCTIDPDALIFNESIVADCDQE